jgi:hypothetical protein
MKSLSAILLAAGLLARTTSAQEAQLGSVTFGTPTCGSDVPSGLLDFNPADCTPAFEQLLDTYCTSGLCNIPPTTPESRGAGISQTVRTCTTFLGYLFGENGATFDEAPVLAAFPGFISECTTHTDDARGLPELVSTNGALGIGFNPSEGFE